MINRQALLSDLQSLLRTIEADLLERSDSAEVPEVGRWLREEYAKAKDAQRTAQTEKQWIDDFVTQVAAAWVLSCVFARFLEDKELVDPPRIAGPGGRLDRARDEHTLFFQDPKRAKLTDREYLLDVFAALAKLPAGGDVFGEHNPMNALPNWLSGDAAGELLRFFQRIDADSGDLVHDFTDPDWDTRFLGDLYQDLSEAARKKYALLQTPEFVEEFILDRTLDPALDEFGLEPHAKAQSREGDSGSKSLGGSAPLRESLFKMIDPACGSGHFLLGAFPRILDRWQRQEPGTNVRELVRRTLCSIHGVDVNPFAIAIARFRLLLAALSASNISRLKDAPAFEMNLACGDSLYHGRETQMMLEGVETDESHYFRTEDAETLRRILKEGSFHCAVANPPYITPKDGAARDAYRRLYSSCHMKYSLAVPFMERIFRLAMRGGSERQAAMSDQKGRKAEKQPLTAGCSPAGYTGQITANSFMKRDFGKKLIEEFFPKVDLTHAIDTSGAYIPGHGTPTVILFGKHQKPVSETVRTVMGINGEPGTPEDPSKGKVWSSILEYVDRADSQSAFVSVRDTPRSQFSRHPWTLSGGGAAELKVLLESQSQFFLRELTDSAGVFGMTNADEVFLIEAHTLCAAGVEKPLFRAVANGDEINDWTSMAEGFAIFPYSEDGNLLDIAVFDGFSKWFWSFRTTLGNRATFSQQTYFREGLPWWKWHQVAEDRLCGLTIAFAEIGTHNRFILDEDETIFSRSANILKLKQGCERQDYLAVLALLNSSVANFWGRQVWQPKGGDQVGEGGARVSRIPWEDRLQRNSSKLRSFPVPRDYLNGIRSGETLHHHFRKRLEMRRRLNASSLDTELLEQLQRDWQESLICAIQEQENLDWQCYQLYGLIDEDLTYKAESFPIQLGQRAFEIVLARKMAAGEVQTTWFERHGSTPITELPAEWPDDYKKLVERRIELIETDKNIRLIEQPEYKRRWNTEPWDSQVERALQSWLLDRLESYFDFDGRMNTEGRPTAQVDKSLISVARLADIAAKDGDFMEVGSVYRDDPAFNVQNLIEELVKAENVPLLPILRYKPAGLRKREQWEETWALQRKEDAGEKVGDIPVPPKYKSADFISTGGAKYWKLRGKLDVPKERWISFPHCEGEDGTLMLAWAGYDHLQQARAVSAHFVDVQERLGGRDDPRLIPLLACLIELLPWLQQWHNEVDPQFDMAMGDYFEGFITEEARNLDMTIEEIKAWEPPKTASRRRKKGKKQ